MKSTIWFLLLLGISGVSAAQTSSDSTKYPKPVNNTAKQNQEHMMQLLGIKKIRPGASANESSPNYANYDPAKADPCPQLPDVLTLKNGKKITTAKDWWEKRRPELSQEIEKELY